MTTERPSKTVAGGSREAAPGSPPGGALQTGTARQAQAKQAAGNAGLQTGTAAAGREPVPEMPKPTELPAPGGVT